MLKLTTMNILLNKNILQLPDMCATFYSILNCTTYNAVGTKKLKPEIDARYNTFPYSS